MANRRFYKNKPSDTIWWVDNTDETGVWLFSFDKVKIYNPNFATSIFKRRKKRK